MKINKYLLHLCLGVVCFSGVLLKGYAENKLVMPPPLICNSLAAPGSLAEWQEKYLNDRAAALDAAMKSPLVSVNKIGYKRLYFHCTSCGTDGLVKPNHDGRPACQSCNHPLDHDGGEVMWLPFAWDREHIPSAFLQLVGESEPFTGTPLWPCLNCGSFTPGQDQGVTLTHCASCGSSKAESDQIIEQLRAQGKPVPSPFEHRGLDRQILEALVQNNLIVYVGDQFLDPRDELRKLDARRNRGRPAHSSASAASTRPVSASNRTSVRGVVQPAVAPRRISHVVVARLATRQAAYIGIGSLLTLGAGALIANHLAQPLPPLQGTVVDRQAQMVVFESLDGYLAYTNPVLSRAHPNEVVLDQSEYTELPSTIAQPGWMRVGDREGATPPRVIDLAKDNSVEMHPSDHKTPEEINGFAVIQYSVTVEVQVGGQRTQNPFLVSREDYLRARIGDQVTITFSGPLDPAIEF